MKRLQFSAGLLACGLWLTAAPLAWTQDAPPPNGAGNPAQTDVPHPTDPVLPLEFAHPAKASTDEGKARLDAIVKAHGGEAFLKLKSYTLKGKGELTPPNGEINAKLPIEALTLTCVEPAKTRLDLTTGFGDVTVAAGGDSAWYRLMGRVTDAPPTILTLANNLDPIRLLKRVVEEKLFVRDLPDDRTAPLPLPDKDKADLTGIDITEPNGRITQVFADKTTHQVRAVVTAGVKGLLFVLLSDYHKTDDVLLPSALQVIQRKTTYLDLTFDSFEVNKPVDDTFFNRPHA